MGWLSKILNYVPAQERKGISLEHDTCWEISYSKNISVPIFLRALADLVPSGSILYLEDGSPTKQILLYLEERKPAKITKVALGTIWPRPKCFHMEITPANLEGLANLAEKIVSPELAIHLHVYMDDKVLLEWHDAFDDNCYVSNEIPEDKIKIFCTKLETQYKAVTFN